MKLTKEDIQFIDTYLKNCGVVYVDIRLEMVDHIASELESHIETEDFDFYEVFKEYMINNKKEILKNNKKRWSFSAVKEFLMFLIKPYLMLLGIMMFLFYRYVNVELYFSKEFTVQDLFFVIFLTIVIIQEIYLKLYIKKQFYVLEKTSIILFFINQGLIFFLNAFVKESASSNILAVFSFLIVGYVMFFVKEMRKFNKHHYNFI